MKIEETKWDHPELETSLGGAILESQPSVGFEILWNVPIQWRKPVLVIHLWNKVITIGWLVS